MKHAHDETRATRERLLTCGAQLREPLARVQAECVTCAAEK